MNPPHVSERSRLDSSGSDGTHSAGPRRRQQRHNEDTIPFTIARQTTIRIPESTFEPAFHALFCLEDVPVDMIDEVLEKNVEEVEDYCFWLADSTFGTVPRVVSDGATRPPISSSWRSPFVGKTIEDVFEFLQTVPKDRKLALDHIAALDKHLYEKKGRLVLYNIDQEGEILPIPCMAESALIRLRAYNNDGWPDLFEDWCQQGVMLR